MTRLQTLLMFALLLTVGGCTTQGMYEGFRQNGRNDCYGKPYDSKHEACSERTRGGFTEYQRKRDAVLHGE